ncbi:GNAT family N-acetyltransferase [Arthrobacter sp. MDT1-65]
MTAPSPASPVPVVVRPELPADADPIHRLTGRAFEGRPFASGTEAEIVRALRESGTLTLSLVAEYGGSVVGHVAFSPVLVSGTGGAWFGLGPISVDPDLQRRGIGRRLVADGLDRLRHAGAAGCALIGDPAVYARYGFVSGGLTYAGVHPDLVQYVAFGSTVPRGTLLFGSAFDG